MKLVVVQPELPRPATAGGAAEFADLDHPAVEWPRHDPARFGGVLGRLIPTELAGKKDD